MKEYKILSLSRSSNYQVLLVTFQYEDETYRTKYRNQSFVGLTKTILIEKKTNAKWEYLDSISLDRPDLRKEHHLLVQTSIEIIDHMNVTTH